MTPPLTPEDREAEPTIVGPGAVVQIRDAFGRWHPAVAQSAPRIDYANAFRGHEYVSVSVWVKGWEHPVNWPDEDVRLPSDGEAGAD